jgi:hypothetical protein
LATERKVADPTQNQASSGALTVFDPRLSDANIRLSFLKLLFNFDHQDSTALVATFPAVFTRKTSVSRETCSIQ